MILARDRSLPRPVTGQGSRRGPAACVPAGRQRLGAATRTCSLLVRVVARAAARTGDLRFSVGRLQRGSNSPAFAAFRKSCHGVRAKRRIGPLRSLLSRTATSPSSARTSTQFVAELRVLVCQPVLRGGL